MLHYIQYFFFFSLDYFNNSWSGGNIGENQPMHINYKLFFNRNNTPYIDGKSAAPVRRLWNYLVEQESVQDVFIKILLNKKNSARRKSMQAENISTNPGKTICTRCRKLSIYNL